MRKYFVRCLLFLCLAAVLLSGCGSQIRAGGLGSERWVETAPLNWGVLESSKLKVLPWNSGRLEETSDHHLVEAENGYYYTFIGRLYYSDKENPELWVPVCGQPDCDHYQLSCKADVGDWIAAKDGRLYFAEAVGSSPQLYSSPGFGYTMVSTDQKAEDKKLAYVFEDGFTLDKGSILDMIQDGMWLYSMQTISQQGEVRDVLYIASEDGIWTYEAPEGGASGTGNLRPADFFSVNGDPFIYWIPWSEDHLLRFTEGRLEESVPLSLIPENGGYISGNILRGMVTNDGYYDINITTGEKVKIADVRMEDSFSIILAPNCIIESTKFGLAAHNNDQCRIDLFDGECWRTVQIPQEMEFLEGSQRFRIVGVASDRIFLEFISSLSRIDSVLYQIKLAEEELKLEYYATVERPEREEEAS